MYTNGSYDLKQGYAVQDLQGPLPIPIIHENTLFGALMNDPQLKNFALLISKANLAGIYNSPNINVTLFAPINCPDPCAVLRSEARKIVLRHTLPRPTPPEFLKSSVAMKLDTWHAGESIISSTINGKTRLNQHSVVLGYKPVGTAILYGIDRPIVA
jgi:hypothetical protein